jgi:tetratricopeptide (TPR) repeat protein
MTIQSILRIAAPFALAATLAFSQAKQPQPKSQKEQEAVMAVFNAQDPDARIAAAEDLLQKFADTEFKAIALQVAAMSAQQKNDFEKMVIYAERTLEADPKNYSAMLMLSSGLAQRTREHDLDKEEKLARSEKYANSAMDLLKTAAKPNPQLTDEQWEGAKKDMTAQAYESLGLAAMARKKYDVAATNFKSAMDTGSQPDPATMVRLASAYNQLSKPDEAIAVLDKINALPDVNPQIKTVAQAERNNSMKLKSGGAKPASSTPAPPPQVEIKK